LGYLAACAFLLPATLIAADRSPLAKAGLHQDESIEVDGRRREFSYFVPSRSSGQTLPMVIYLHGHGDNMRHIVGKGIVPSASAQWMKVAERESFLIFYPMGLEGSDRKTGWNDCRTDTETNPHADDIRFVKELIQFADKTIGVDRTRIYVTGMSNGGHMTARIAMEMSDQIAAVATVSSLLPKQSLCLPPSRPVPIMTMHGTEDPIAPFKGGSMAADRGAVYSFGETVDIWRKWNGLENVKAETRQLLDRDRSDGSMIIEHSWATPSNSSVVIALEMKGAGHTEPSRVAKINRLLARIQGSQNRDVEMADTVWEFFSRHTSAR